LTSRPGLSDPLLHQNRIGARFKRRTIAIDLAVAYGDLVTCRCDAVLVEITVLRVRYGLQGVMEVGGREGQPHPRVKQLDDLVLAKVDTARVDQALGVGVLRRAAAQRTAAVPQTAWRALDDLAGSVPETLRKGPRGGGRDRDEIVAHVVDSERAYARKIGIRHRPLAAHDRSALAALRTAILDVLGNPADGARFAGNGWPPAYAARRFAWHVLDHVWEIDDRS
jgi:hypothetical protein